MDFEVKQSEPQKQRSDCIVAGVFEGSSLSQAAVRLDEASGGQISRILKSGDLQGKPGETLILHGVSGTNAARVLLVGCGKRDQPLSDSQFQRALLEAAAVLTRTGARDAAVYLADIEVQGLDLESKLKRIATAFAAGVYRFNRLKTNADAALPKLKKLVVASEKNDVNRQRSALTQAQAIAEGMGLAKDLANLPGNICTPSYLANQAKTLGRQYASVKTKVLNQADMEKLGMGALLSVARGSRQPPKMIALEYNSGKGNKDPVVLVGKGITFDSGGISIKPAAQMDEMKFDMCGAASVLGALVAVARLKLPISVVGLIPTCENMPDGDANKPGDIVTSLSGQTIEVLNTDAEGRLILCDALTYAERYRPAAVVDVATLTGACVIALGKHASGLLSNDEDLAGELLAAGERSGDRVWRLPLWDDYQESLDSNFADMANVGSREGGTITAACFLSRFTKSLRWAHLDIAGSAWDTGKTKGATGRPVPLLVEFLLGRS
ncbi:MAG: leucyl aminopeptidase [Gammaproteobacteria bacterium]